MAGKIGSINKNTGKVITDPRNKTSSGSSAPVASTSTPLAYNQGEFDAALGKLNSVLKPKGNTPIENNQPSAPTVEAPVDVSQPSPSTVNATPFTQPQTEQVPYEQAQANLIKSGVQGNDLSQAQNNLANAYKQASAVAKQSGQAPQDAGQARTQVQQAMSSVPGQEAPTILGGVVETDSTFDSIFSQYDDFFSPPKQKKSLLKEYQSLSRSLGIQEMNEELIDAKRIIEGTEDDIRAEVTATGGFATDSQVMALANSRNKSLIKNYNYLLESRDSAMTQLNTMMDLSIQDRKAAEAEFDRKMDFAFKVSEFKERATTNARNTYLSLGDKMGWDTLVSSVSPYERGILQKTLGISDEALNNLAIQSQSARIAQQSEDALNLELKGEQIKTEKAQRAKIYETVNEKKVDEAEKSNLTLNNLLLQYRDKLNNSNPLTRMFNPNVSADINSIKGLITAEYKKAKTLGTLDAGVQKLIDSVLGGGGISVLSTSAQVGAVDNFLKSQGVTPNSGQGQTKIYKGSVYKKVDGGWQKQ